MNNLSSTWGGGGEQTQKLKTCLYIFVQQTNQSLYSTFKQVKFKHNIVLVNKLVSMNLYTHTHTHTHIEREREREDNIYSLHFNQDCISFNNIRLVNLIFISSQLNIILYNSLQ